MHLLVKLKTKDGSNEYDEILNIENVVIFDNRTSKPVHEITEDLVVRVPAQSIKLDKKKEKKL